MPLERFLEESKRKKEEGDQPKVEKKEEPQSSGACGDWGSFEEEDVFHTLSTVSDPCDDPLSNGNSLGNLPEEQFYSLVAPHMSTFSGSSRSLVPKSERPDGAMLNTIRTEEGRLGLDAKMKPALELLDAEENLKFDSTEDFLLALHLDPKEKVTVRQLGFEVLLMLVDSVSAWRAIIWL